MLSQNKSFWITGVLIFTLSGCASAPYKCAVIQPPGIYHIVGSEQNLYRISKAYGVDMKEIMRLNNISEPNQLGVGDKLFIPRASTPIIVEPYRSQTAESVEKIVGRRQYRVRWNRIALHHSATLEGNAEAFDRNHRSRKMGGLFYHFVIGNGSASGDGEIEVGWRWRRQVEVERKGEIEICLVGDFNRQQVSEQEFKSLVGLIKVLMREYSIPVSHIRRHKDVVNKVTECPGDCFPFNKLLAELKKAS